MSLLKRAKKQAICKNLQYSNGNKRSGPIDAPSTSKIDVSSEPSKIDDSSELSFTLRAKLLNTAIKNDLKNAIVLKNGTFVLSDYKKTCRLFHFLLDVIKAKKFMAKKVFAVISKLMKLKRESASFLLVTKQDAGMNGKEIADDTVSRYLKLGKMAYNLFSTISRDLNETNNPEMLIEVLCERFGIYENELKRAEEKLSFMIKYPVLIADVQQALKKPPALSAHEMSTFLDFVSFSIDRNSAVDCTPIGTD